MKDLEERARKLTTEVDEVATSCNYLTTQVHKLENSLNSVAAKVDDLEASARILKLLTKAMMDGFMRDLERDNERDGCCCVREGEGRGR